MKALDYHRAENDAENEGRRRVVRVKRVKWMHLVVFYFLVPAFLVPELLVPELLVSRLYNHFVQTFP